MIQAVKHTYEGMNQDASKSKLSNNYYFKGKNIRILSTDTSSTGSVTNDKGNKLVLTIPTPIIDYDNKIINYGDKTLLYTTDDLSSLSPSQSTTQILIGSSIGKNNIVLLTTDNNGFDCIWKINDNFELTLLYLRNLNFSTNNPVQAITNYENNNIEKVYWVDGKNQMRFLNINQSIENGDNKELIDIESSLINVVGNFNFAQPEIIAKEQGGTHTAGMIQYGYILYTLNGATTKLSPLSNLVPLDNGDAGGGQINSIVNTYPVVKIPVLDSDYTNIRLYSLKYTSYNELPEVKLILDRNTDNLTELIHYDTGSFINTVTLDEFSFLGGNTIYIPKHINTKFNRLFSANYQEKTFDVDIDTRSYSFPELSGNSSIYESLTYDSLTDTVNGVDELILNNITINTVPKDHNCLNKDFDTYKYQFNSSILGGTGKYLSWELFRSEVGVATDNITSEQASGKFFKDREIYRIGVQFYNRKAQISLPKWITDFKVNTIDEENNLNGFYATLKINFNLDFFTWLNTSSNFLDDDGNYDEDLKPVGFKLLRAERTLNDRSVTCQGIVNGSYVIRNTVADNNNNFIPVGDPTTREIYNNHPKLPSLMRPFDGSILPFKGSFNYARVDDNDTLHPSAAEFCYSVRDAGTGIWSGATFIPATYTTICNPAINPGQRGNGVAEIFNSVAAADKRSMVYQFNQLMQLYSPEITFNQVQRLENSKLNVVGTLNNDYNAFWGKMININTKVTHTEGKIFGEINPYSSNFNVTSENDPFLSPQPTETEYADYVTQITAEHNATYGAYAGDVPLYIPTYQEYIETINTFNSDQNEEGFSAIVGDIKTFSSWGLIGPQGVGRRYRTYDYQPQYQLYRRYTGNYNYSNNIQTYDVYGNPLIIETGADRTVYNRDNDLTFYNTFSIMNTDTGEDSDNSPNWRVKELNSWGARCVLFSLGDKDDDTIDRIDTKQLFNDISGITVYDPLTDILADDAGKVGLISEMTLGKSTIYLGLLYGGNDYESRKRTNYIEIGSYTPLLPSVGGDLTYKCVNGGDTFISDFKFTKIVKTDTEISAVEIPQFTEIVNVKLETTVDLKNRSDYSTEDWDSRFQPRYEEYQDYNRVYSQEPNFFVRKDVDYNFKAVNKFENGIIASKVKTPGEFIDSWLSYQSNDVMYLDGKHGSINSLHSFKDEIYTLQDRAIAQISINPRVQVQGSDGIAIQLGTGSVLDRYTYLSTMSGTLNKWSVVNSPNAFYYYDALNKTLNLVTNELSDVKGMHSYFIKNTTSDLEVDNPLIGKGVVSTYDYLNNDLLFTFLQDNNNFTISYNELKQNFISFYDFTPNHYISVGDNLLSVNSQNNLNNEIYQHGIGEYNNYYNTYFNSYVTILSNPQNSDLDCTFNNIEFKSELYKEGADQPLSTINKIHVWNEHQDTGEIDLIVNSNISRKFRDWRLNIPRQQYSRNRIRNPWTYIKLILENGDNKQLILHDVIVYYSL